METRNLALNSTFVTLVMFQQFQFYFFINLLIEASNCGGVAVSGLEMARNSQRLAWTSQEVDAKLKGIMAEFYNVCFF